MGDYIGVYRFGYDGLVASERIGSASSARVLCEQWLAGYALRPPGANAKDAARVRANLVYHGPDRSLEYVPKSVEWLREALRDTTDDSTWVSGHINYRGLSDFERMELRAIHCAKLYGIMLLWHSACEHRGHSFIVRITEDLLSGLRISTEALEAEDAAWAGRCRHFYTMLSIRGSEGSLWAELG